VDGMSLKQLADSYIQEKFLRPATAKNYRTIAEIASRDLNEITVQSLQNKHLLGWRNVIINRASQTTWNTYARHLKALLNFACTNGFIEHTPLENSLFVPAGKRKVKTVSIDTIRKAKQFLDQPASPLKPGWFWSILISTLYYTAMRRAQIAGLQWRDINFDKRVIYYRETNSKTHDEWQVPLTDALAEELKKLLNQTSQATGLSSPYLQTRQVFNASLFNPRYKGKNLLPDQISQFFRRLSNHIGEPISAHMLRHSTTTVLTDIRRHNGGSLRVAQQILGHASITTTAVYVHPDLEQMRTALEALPLIRK